MICWRVWRVSGSSSSSSLLLLLTVALLLLFVVSVIVPLAVEEEKELYDGATAGLNAVEDAASLPLVVDAEIMLL